MQNFISHMRTKWPTHVIVIIIIIIITVLIVIIIIKIIIITVAGDVKTNVSSQTLPYSTVNYNVSEEGPVRCPSILKYDHLYMKDIPL